VEARQRTPPPLRDQGRTARAGQNPKSQTEVIKNAQVFARCFTSSTILVKEVLE